MRNRGSRAAHAVALAAGGLLLSLATGAFATTAPPNISTTCAEALAHQRPEHPKLVRTQPPAGLTSILGVLRQPTTPNDVLPKGGVPTSYAVLWIEYVRLLASTGRTRYFLIPGVYVDPLPAVCRAGLSAKTRHEEARYDREQRDGSVSLEAFNSAGGDGAIPLTRQAIDHGDVFITPGPSAKTTPAYGIVPDGVASVTIRGRSGRPISATVASNFYLMRIPVSLKGTAHHKTEVFTVRWLASSGSVVKQFAVKLDSLSGSV